MKLSIFSFFFFFDYFDCGDLIHRIQLRLTYTDWIAVWRIHVRQLHAPHNVMHFHRVGNTWMNNVENVELEMQVLSRLSTMSRRWWWWWRQQQFILFFFRFFFLFENRISVHGFCSCLGAAINNEMTINHIVAGCWLLCAGRSIACERDRREPLEYINDIVTGNDRFDWNEILTIRFAVEMRWRRWRRRPLVFHRTMESAVSSLISINSSSIHFYLSLVSWLSRERNSVRWRTGNPYRGVFQRICFCFRVCLCVFRFRCLSPLSCRHRLAKMMATIRQRRTTTL